MAKPRVFLSSTSDDFVHIREVVGSFIRDYGFEEVLHENAQVPYGRDGEPEMYCYEEIEICDILVSIVGGRFGTESSLPGYSITQREIGHAIEIGKQIYIFVQKNVLTEYETYKLNRHNPNMEFKQVDDRRIYEFLDELHSLPTKRPIFVFEKSQDIIRKLREQWAGLFQRLLHHKSQKPFQEKMNMLNNATMTLHQILSAYQHRFSQETVSDILLFHHPAYLRVRDLLKLPIRVVFSSLSELEDTLAYFQFTKAVHFSTDQYWEWTKHDNGSQWVLRINRWRLFDDNGKLKHALPEHWEENLILLELNEIEVPAPD